MSTRISNSVSTEQNIPDFTTKVLILLPPLYRLMVSPCSNDHRERIQMAEETLTISSASLSVSKGSLSCFVCDFTEYLLHPSFPSHSYDHKFHHFTISLLDNSLSPLHCQSALPTTDNSYSLIFTFRLPLTSPFSLKTLLRGSVVFFCSNSIAASPPPHHHCVQ